jgi:transcriptional regulator with XRE-family HTH domain
MAYPIDSPRIAALRAAPSRPFRAMAAAEAAPRFGRALRAARLGAGLSQPALAELAGYDHSFVSRLEHGGRRPSRAAVGFLSTALGLDAPGRDALLAAAGFLPDDPESLLAGEPEVADLMALLRDPALPGGYRDGLRRLLWLLGDQARLVRAGMDGGIDP